MSVASDWFSVDEMSMMSPRSKLASIVNPDFRMSLQSLNSNYRDSQVLSDEAGAAVSPVVEDLEEEEFMERKISWVDFLRESEDPEVFAQYDTLPLDEEVQEEVSLEDKGTPKKLSLFKRVVRWVKSKIPSKSKFRKSKAPVPVQDTESEQCESEKVEEKEKESPVEDVEQAEKIESGAVESNSDNDNDIQQSPKVSDATSQNEPKQEEINEQTPAQEKEEVSENETNSQSESKAETQKESQPDPETKPNSPKADNNLSNESVEVEIEA